MFKFQQLKVWKLAIEFCDFILEYTESLPKQYQYSLGDQLKRAVISIPTNIAEGSGRKTQKESSNFFNYAKGSVYEVVSLLTIASKRNLLHNSFDREKIYQMSEKIAKMLSGLIKRK